MTGKARPTLSEIMAGLKVKNKRKAEVNPLNEEWIRKHTPVERPHAEWLMDAIPPPTEFEQAQDWAQGQRLAKPHTSRGPDPRKPWVVKGGYKVERISEITEGPKTYDEAQALRGKATPGQPQGVQDRIRLNNVHVKIKQGKRLTKAERKLKGKWDLARIVAGLRPKQSD